MEHEYRYGDWGKLLGAGILVQHWSELGKHMLPQGVKHAGNGKLSRHLGAFLLP